MAYNPDLAHYKISIERKNTILLSSYVELRDKIYFDAIKQIVDPSAIVFAGSVVYFKYLVEFCTPDLAAYVLATYNHLDINNTRIKILPFPSDCLGHNFSQETVKVHTIFPQKRRINNSIRPHGDEAGGSSISPLNVDMPHSNLNGRTLDYVNEMFANTRVSGNPNDHFPNTDYRRLFPPMEMEPSLQFSTRHGIYSFYPYTPFSNPSMLPAFGWLKLHRIPVEDAEPVERDEFPQGMPDFME